jgi:hypothetical protein
MKIRSPLIRRICLGFLGVFAIVGSALVYSDRSTRAATEDLLASNDALIAVTEHMTRNKGEWPNSRDELAHTVNDVFGPMAAQVQNRLDRRIEFNWNLDLDALSSIETPEERSNLMAFRTGSGLVVPAGSIENVYAASVAARDSKPAQANSPLDPVTSAR